MNIRFKTKNYKKGVAILMVLIVVMLMTSIIFDLIYSSRVSSRISSNFASDVKAYYLSKAAFNFAKIFLKYDMQAQEQISSQMESMLSGSGLGGIQLGNIDPSSMHLWDVMPMSYPPQVELLTSLLGFSSSEEDEKDNEEKEPSTQDEDADDDGRYEIEVIDESHKININALKDEKIPAAGEHRLTIDLLINLFNQESFKELFKDEASNKREVLAYQILDWIDENYESENPRVGGDENAPYYRLSKPYKPKNGPFHSIEELNLIADMEDKYYKAFSPYLTVYGEDSSGKIDAKINVKVAPKEVIATFFNDSITNKMELAEKVVDLRTSESKENLEASKFLDTVRLKLKENGSLGEEITSCADLFLSALCRDKKNYITNVSSKFQVIAKGLFKESEKKIISVIDRGKSFSDEIRILYWRIE
ncbi:MAG: hypothetical protein ABIA04_08255 [Pseudomonadota bacterium]